MPEYPARWQTRMIANGQWDIRRFAAQIARKEHHWLDHPTAMLIIHGMGNQIPLGTLDSFARGLAETMQELCGAELEIEHRFEKVTDGSIWFDNYVRIKRKDDAADTPYLDVHEYYWANYAHNRASIAQIRMWVRDTVRQARKFYAEYADELRQTSPGSSFFGRGGSFRKWRYQFFLFILGQIIPVLMWIAGLVPKLLKAIPVAGTFFSGWMSNKIKEASYGFANVIGDVVIYNTSDAKTEHFKIRQDILAGAVASLRRLVEPREGEDHGDYSRVILCGHSLGSQIAFDAMNRLNHLITQDAIRGINTDGTYKTSWQGFGHIADVLCGFVTFGSPLDKIAFFFREQIEKQEYVRLQLLRNYHSFKQRLTEIKPPPKFTIKTSIPRLFDDILWINYHDRHDYVSGRLDFYEKLVNVDCNFRSRWFSITHGWYWNSKNMFTDIIENFLLYSGGLRHTNAARGQPAAEVGERGKGKMRLNPDKW